MARPWWPTSNVPKVSEDLALSRRSIFLTRRSREHLQRNPCLAGSDRTKRECQDRCRNQHQHARAGGECARGNSHIQQAATDVSSSGKCQASQAQIRGEDASPEAIFGVKLQQRGGENPN